MSTAPTHRKPDPMRLGPRDPHLQLSVPTHRPPAARPYEREGGELRVGRHTVIRSPNWGCSSIPYLYVLRINGEVVTQWTAEPTAAQCVEAERLWRDQRAAVTAAPAAAVPIKRGRGRPRKP